jgi:hypothetical protein
MIASVAGALVSPFPEPSNTVWPTISRHLVDVDADAVQARPAASESKPPTTTCLVPKRTASLVPTTDVTATLAASGSSQPHAG